MFGVLGWVVFGLIVGVIAKLLMPGRDPGGFIITALLGIVGAVFAGWLGRAAGWYGPDEGAGLIASIVGAVVLLALYRIVVGRRTVA
jgi:uncharacterized membrane protein YeaQ/YmgE (transglycosylase-associated protein family)